MCATLATLHCSDFDTVVNGQKCVYFRKCRSLLLLIPTCLASERLQDFLDSFFPDSFFISYHYINVKCASLELTCNPCLLVLGMVPVAS